MKSLLKIYITVLFIGFSFLGCDDENCITGEGNLETRTLDLSTLDKVSLYGLDQVSIKQGEIQEIKVTGYPNIIDDLNTNISNQEWQIRLKDGCYSNADMNIEITVPSLKAANLTGSGKIIIGDFLNQENQLFALSGSGSIEIKGNTGTEELVISISGSGDISFFDDFNDLDMVRLNISGSGDFDAFPLKSKEYEARLTGSGNANLYVENELNGSITGSGNINYKGNPSINVVISGSGKVNNSN